jgi:hypothetical protein
MVNITDVPAEANRLAIEPWFDLCSMYYKVCGRRAADLTQIRAAPARCVGNELKRAYPQVDVCRQDRPPEIAATGAHQFRSMSGQQN